MSAKSGSRGAFLRGRDGSVRAGGRRVELGPPELLACRRDCWAEEDGLWPSREHVWIAVNADVIRRDVTGPDPYASSVLPTVEKWTASTPTV